MMTIGYKYATVAADGDTFKKACNEAVTELSQKGGAPVRCVFFGKPKDKKEYLAELEIIEEALDNVFGERKPVFSYVSQEPFGAKVAIEAHYINGDASLRYETVDDTDYIVAETADCKHLFVGGLRGDIDTALSEQCAVLFAKAEKLLHVEGMTPGNIVRQWNYIEEITGFVGEFQNYQVFNDARTKFYGKAEWPDGYPAATGIGAGICGVVVDFNAVKGVAEVTPLDNALQVPAHDYSQNVLIGAEDEVLKSRTTPKFERGKVVVSDGGALGYISGTASIRGEESVGLGNIEEQTKVTMENIDYLMSLRNIADCGSVSVLEVPKYALLRVYVKRENDMEWVSRYMRENHPETALVFLNTDVCRDELLIEIEGVALYEMKCNNKKQ